MSADVYGLVLDDHVSDLVLDGHCAVNLVLKDHVNVPVYFYFYFFMVVEASVKKFHVC